MIQFDGWKQQLQQPQMQKKQMQQSKETKK